MSAMKKYILILDMSPDGPDLKRNGTNVDWTICFREADSISEASRKYRDSRSLDRYRTAGAWGWRFDSPSMCIRPTTISGNPSSLHSLRMTGAIRTEARLFCRRRAYLSHTSGASDSRKIWEGLEGIQTGIPDVSSYLFSAIEYRLNPINGCG